MAASLPKRSATSRDPAKSGCEPAKTDVERAGSLPKRVRD